jgi:protein-arginine deiminase
MRCEVIDCGVTSKLRLCLRCQKLFCSKHYGEQLGSCMPADRLQRMQFLKARERRRQYDREFEQATQHLGITAKCTNKELTVRVIDDVTGRGVPRMFVKLRVGELTPASQGNGRYHFTGLTDTTVYTVMVQCRGNYGGAQFLTAATAGRDREVVVKVKRYALCLALDADLDGVVDDPDGDFATWSLGAGATGAVVLFNNLNTAGQFEDDLGNLPILNTADDVTSADELPYLAPLDIVGIGDCPADYVATLSAEPAGMLRIFYNDQAVLGPGIPAWDIPIPQKNDRLNCHMEATGYPSAAFKGLVTLTLKLEDGAGAVATMRAEVRVSPWIMHNALDELEAVYALDISKYKGMHRDSYERVACYLTDLEAALGVERVIRVDFTPLGSSGGDRSVDLFLRDVMSCGYSSMPGGDGTRHVHVVLGPMHDRAESFIHHYPMTLSGPDIGFHLPGGAMVNSEDTCNYFGNFLCSPPTATAKLGCIFYGTCNYTLNRDLDEFLRAQGQPLCPLDVGWLTIRHVDEVVTFVPSPQAAGFSVVMPSPRLAVQLLRTVLEHNVDAAVFSELEDGAEPVSKFLNDASFMRGQEEVHAKLDLLAKKIGKQLGIDPANFIYLPVLYEPPTGYLAPYFKALTPNVVNMLVGTCADGVADLCMPKPYGPHDDQGCVFQQEIVRLLGPTNNRIHWIRNFHMYHSSDGEVHCATNSVRKPRNGGWWTLA